MTTLALIALLAAAEPRPQIVQSGHVVDASTGSPLAARVAVAETKASVTAGADGGFTVDLNPGAGTTLTVSFPGYYPVRYTVAAPTSAGIEVRLAPVISLADRIEVTATRAREGIDAASFTNLPQERIQEAYWGQDPAMLLSQLTPGLFATNDSGQGIGYSYFSIRGFGQARTRVMLDGVPLNDAESGELFFIDLADFLATAGDVQVQRGVFGLSGLGGAVDLTTASPAVEPAFTLQAGAGSFGTRRFTARFESGLVAGGWALSARYSRVTTDGYRDQSWADMWNYYFSLARYGHRSRLRLVLFGGPEQTHLAYDGIPRGTLDGELTGDADRDRRTNPLAYPGEIDNFFQPHYRLIHDLSLTTNTRFSQTFYVFEGDGYYDQFRGNRKLAEYNLPPATSPDGSSIARSDLVRRRNVDEWDAGWLPTLTHETGRWTLALNGELRFHEAHHFGEVKWAQDYPAGVAPDRRYYDYEAAKDTETLAAQVRFRAADRLRLTAGLQYARHSYGISKNLVGGVSLDEDYEFLLPRVGAVLTLGKTTDAYVTAARGQREPFLRNIYDPQTYGATPASLRPEEVWDYEAGVSTRHTTWHARANLFFMNFQNEIVYAGALDDNGVPIYGNGARSHHTGVELDGGLQPSRRFGLDATLSLARNSFTRYREFGYDGSEAVYDGNRIAGYPDVMASLTARTELGGVRLSLSGRYVGRFFLDNTADDQRVNPAYTVVDVAARAPLPRSLSRPLGLQRLELDLRVNNLLGERYTSFGYFDGYEPLYIAAAPTHAYVGLTLGF